MPASIRMGFIGAGHVLQEIHLPLFSQMEEVLPLILCDLREAALSNALRKFGIRETTRDWHDLLAVHEVDAVIVTLPNDLHAEVSIRALQSGKHVLCEKPAAIDEEGARRIVGAAQESGCIYMMALPHRFDAESALLKQLIAAGELGEIHHIRAGLVRRDACPGAWFTDRKRSGGGALVQFGSHLIDLILWLMDFPRVERVSAVCYQKCGPMARWKPRGAGGAVHDVEDAASVMLRFEGGRSAVLETAWTLDTDADRQYLEVYGDRAGASLWPLRIYGQIDGVEADIAPRYTHTHNYQLLARHFVERVLAHQRGERTPPAHGTPADGLRLATLTRLVYQSAEAGREVEVGGKPATLAGTP